MNRILIGCIIIIVICFAWEFVFWAIGVKPLLPYRLQAENYNLIDVRTKAEYKLFHIDGAKNHPELLFHPERLKPQDASKPLVVICMTGHRSSVVAYRLKRLGYNKIYNLTFGMLGWLVSGGETS